MQPKSQSLVKSELNRLKELAKRASGNAYCPYSKFPVGALVITDQDQEYAACNVENASYGLSQCAERNAVARMIAQGAQRIACVIIYTPTAKPTTPCGACRQVINEFGSDARVICLCESDELIDTSLSKLLPHAFGPGNLS